MKTIKSNQKRKTKAHRLIKNDWRTHRQKQPNIEFDSRKMSNVSRSHTFTNPIRLDFDAKFCHQKLFNLERVNLAFWSGRKWTSLRAGWIFGLVQYAHSTKFSRVCEAKIKFDWSEYYTLFRRVVSYLSPRGKESSLFTKDGLFSLLLNDEVGWCWVSRFCESEPVCLFSLAFYLARFAHLSGPTRDNVWRRKTVVYEKRKRYADYCEEIGETVLRIELSRKRRTFF